MLRSRTKSRLLTSPTTGAVFKNTAPSIRLQRRLARPPRSRIATPSKSRRNCEAHPRARPFPGLVSLRWSSEARFLAQRRSQDASRRRGGLRCCSKREDDALGVTGNDTQPTTNGRDAHGHQRRWRGRKTRLCLADPGEVGTKHGGPPRGLTDQFRRYHVTFYVTWSSGAPFLTASPTWRSSPKSRGGDADGLPEHAA
jgi:hypothetical protein